MTREELIDGSGIVNSGDLTTKLVHPILITTYGLKVNSYSDNIQSVVTMDDLFS
jgi:hypothetical protein